MMNRRYYESLKAHQIASHGISWLSLPVVLESSDNTYLSYPARGVIRFAEQGTDLFISQAVFHLFARDGSLGAPVTVKNAVFRYEGRPEPVYRTQQESGGEWSVYFGVGYRKGPFPDEESAERYIDSLAEEAVG